MSDFHIEQDRRKRRSEETLEAITYQLEHVVEEFGMDMMVLADHQGTIVASAGAPRLAEVFAAHAPKLHETDDLKDAVSCVVPDLPPHHVLVESLSIEEMPLYLCAVTGGDDDSQRGFERAQTGIKRIYRTTDVWGEGDG